MSEVPEQLLHDIAWLRGLATTLATDRDDADDLVQEARIAAWQRRPDTTRPLRGWLTKVVRDLAGMKRRSDRRRVARDAVAADRARAAATPDEALAQVRLHRLLAELVLDLAEPYRSTVIARFVEGRTSASIAKSLGIPAGTVRKRLHEALARLRAGLDARSAGDRTQWAPAVLAFAKGGILVAKPIKLVVVVVAALLLLASTAIVIVALVVRSGAPPETAAASGPVPAAVGASPSATARAVDAPTHRLPGGEHGAAERTTMLAAIASAREVRAHRDAASPAARAPAAVGASIAPAGDSPGTTLDLVDNTGDTSAWEKRALATLNGLLGQCYDLGRAEDPALAGTVVVRFTVVGEPGVGGLLDGVEIVDANTTIDQQTLRDCVTQQLYALELDPPPDGVKVARELSLAFP